jgi:hypothetical protein
VRVAKNAKREKRCPNFETAAKGIRERAVRDVEDELRKIMRMSAVYSRLP